VTAPCELGCTLALSLHRELSLLREAIGLRVKQTGDKHDRPSMPISPTAKPRVMRAPTIPDTFSASGYRYLFLILFFLFCMALQITHDALLSPELNLGAEDGGYIYADALQYPFWRTWLAPMVQPGLPPMGYFLLLQRMVGSFAALFPPAWGPHAVYVGTYALHTLSAMYILSSRFSVYVPSLFVRALIALYIVLLPTLYVYRGSVTGSIQYLFLAVIALIVASPKPLGTRTTITDTALLLIVGLSCPSVVFLMPLFLLRYVSDRDRHSLVLLCTATAVSLAHLVSVQLSGRPGESDLGRLFSTGALELVRSYFDVTILRVFLNAFFAGYLAEIRPLTYLSGPQLVVGCAFMVSVVLLSLRLHPRFRWALIYVVFVPHIAAIFFYATKTGFTLDQLIRGIGGERYFFAGIASVGMITIANIGIRGIGSIAAALLSAFLFDTAVVQTYVAPSPVLADTYFDWRRQVPCLQGLGDGTRGTCWLTFKGAPPQGWKRIITAPIAVEKLGPLGVVDLVDYQVQFNPGAHEFVVTGWAADPKGPTYPAAVFASVEAVGDFRQFGQFNMIELWERLGGRARHDDMHSLGFSAKFPESPVAPMLDAGKPVTVRIKIVAFDLSGYYSAPYSYRINPDRTTITKVME
jgi:hypothetical protein